MEPVNFDYENQKMLSQVIAEHSARQPQPPKVKPHHVRKTRHWIARMQVRVGQDELDTLFCWSETTFARAIFWAMEDLGVTATTARWPMTAIIARANERMHYIA